MRFKRLPTQICAESKASLQGASAAPWPPQRGFRLVIRVCRTHKTPGSSRLVRFQPLLPAEVSAMIAPFIRS